MIRAVVFDCFGVLCQPNGICNDPLIELTRSLHGRYQTAMLSNISRKFVNQLFTQEELDELFDTVVLSGELGIAKPTAEIYELTAMRLGVQPEECIMIDDSQINIDGACRVGMQGLYYENLEQCRKELNKILEINNA